MDALTALLTRERLLVELVVFKLVELRQLLLAGETRFLPWASEEVERAVRAVRVLEVERAVVVQSLATARGLPAAKGDELSLSELVADAPEPWRTVLADAQSGLRQGADEIAELLLATRRLAEAGSRSLAETLQRLDGRTDGQQGAEPIAYGRGWSTSGPAPRVEQSL